MGVIQVKKKKSKKSHHLNPLTLVIFRTIKKIKELHGSIKKQSNLFFLNLKEFGPHNFPFRIIKKTDYSNSIRWPFYAKADGF